MKTYRVTFIQNGDLYESIVSAGTRDQARKFIATKYNIPIKFESGTIYQDEYNYVSAVIEL